VKQSGGYIWVSSELGSGTTFDIYLPRVDEQVDVPEEAIQGDALPGGRETVLLVEDEEGVRKLAAEFLMKHGYSVLQAIHEGDALQVCKRYQGPIHLMLTDVVMPGMSGRELADRLKPSYPEMKVIYMSGYTDDTIVHHGLLMEEINYVQKPFSMEALAKKVLEALGKDATKGTYLRSRPPD
jgi:two-component system cell cycle sensor histidine kinase/response regulator CckA